MKKVKIPMIIACCLSLLLALAGCGGSSGSGESGISNESEASQGAGTPQGYSGAWRYDSDDNEYWLDLGENGRVFQYDVPQDLVSIGTWAETEEGVTVTWEYGTSLTMQLPDLALELQLTDDGEGGLLINGTGAPYTRDPDLEVPRTTVWTLGFYSWIDPESGYELCFYIDDSWDISDSNYDIEVEGPEGGTAVDGYAIMLTTTDGEELELTLSEEGTSVTGYGDMVFVRGDLIDDLYYEDDWGYEDGTYQEADVSDFYGSWEYTDVDEGVVVYEDGTFKWIGTVITFNGTYELEDGELVMDNGMRFTLDGEGGLIDLNGSRLVPTPPLDPSDIAPFVGEWSYDESTLYVSIYEDGTSDWTYYNGGSNTGTGWMEDDVLYVELDNGSIMEFSLYGDGLIDQNGNTLSRDSDF